MSCHLAAILVTSGNAMLLVLSTPRAGTGANATIEASKQLVALLSATRTIRDASRLAILGRIVKSVAI